MVRRAGVEIAEATETSPATANPETVAATSPQPGAPLSSERISFEAIETDTIKILPAIADGACGIDFPLKVTALVDGQVVVTPEATLGCPVTEALEAWLSEAVQPAALAWIGSPVVEIGQLSNYACRKRNNFGSGYSEHAFGNALDIATFTFANGRKLTIAKDWDSSAAARGFFREVFATACQRFTTTLGPGSNIMHYNHIHIDLAEVAPDNSPRMCKPPPDPLPARRATGDGEMIAAESEQPSPQVAGPSATVPATTDTAVPGAD